MSIELNYTAHNRKVEVDVSYIPVENISFPLNVTAVIAESHLIDPQADHTITGGVDQEYEHNHVLRDIITAPQGDPIVDEFVRGEIYKQSFSYTIPPEDGWWVAENCDIIVFISEATPDSKRVLQVVSQDVIQ